MRQRIRIIRRGALLEVLLLVLVAVLAGAYFHYDQETAILTDEARRGVAGSFIRLPDGVVHYELGGPQQARAVVLVHGFSVPYYIWDPTFDALVRAGRRVLRYDLYGRGYSDRPDTDYNTDLYDRQLSSLLSSLQIQEPVDLMGLSMGGPIVVTFAARHPEKVHTLTLFDPSYSSGGTPPLWLRAPFLGEYLMTVFFAPSLPQGQMEDFYRPERFARWPEMYRVQMKFKGFRRALLSTSRTFSRRNQRADYARVGESFLPVLLIWGKEDKGLPVDLSEDVQKVIPQAELHIIEQAAHLPHYERPEIVNPILIDFLNEWAVPNPLSRGYGTVVVP
jgi:pimeloyl-ACP methyl ester carboxylesterase